jgi:hypothetical protein
MNYNFRNVLVTKNELISICDKISNQTGITDMYTNIKIFLITHLPEIFTFSEGAKAIMAKTGDNDNIFLYGYVAFVMEILTSTVPYEVVPNTGLLKIPGSESSYSEIVDDSKSKLTFVCYNLTDDPNELTNLADPKNIKQIYTSLFTDLNNALNVSIIENKCSNFITILPIPEINNGITSLINSVYNNLAENLTYNLLKKLTYSVRQLSNESFNYKNPESYSSPRANNFYNMIIQPNVYPATGAYNSTTTTTSTASFVSNDLSSSSTSSSTATASGGNMDTAIMNSAATAQAYAMKDALQNLQSDSSGAITVSSVVVSTVQAA